MGALKKRGSIWWVRYSRNGKRYEESSGSTKRTTAPAGRAGRPNIVVVLTDDLDLASFADAARFPKFHELMTARGTYYGMVQRQVASHNENVDDVWR